MRQHPYRTTAMNGTPESDEHDASSELVAMENVVVGAVLAATGTIGLLLGLVRPDCTLEAAFGVLLLLLGFATLFTPRRT